MSEFPESCLKMGVNLAASTLVASGEGKGQNSQCLESRIPFNLPIFFLSPISLLPSAVPVVIESGIWKGQDSLYSSVGEDIWNSVSYTEFQPGTCCFMTFPCPPLEVPADYFIGFSWFHWYQAASLGLPQSQLRSFSDL